jgi:hypothetical protein
MKYLFIDNFRGFSKATIPIRDVNFLVGQNSTGKTSFLGLLKLLSSPRFLFDQEFADEHVSFGHFADMVSAHSRDRRRFHIGLTWQTQSKKKEDAIVTGWLLTYIEDEGIPRLSRLTFCRGAQKFSIQFRGNNLFVKRDSIKVPQSIYKIVAALPRWVEEHCSDNRRGYEKLEMPTGFAGRVPLLVAFMMGFQEQESAKTRTKNKKAIEVTMPPPEEIIFAPDLAWVAPIRTKPKPTYGEPIGFSPEGEHTPYLIRRMLRSKSDAKKFHRFMTRFGKASGLFQDVTIKHFGREPGNPFEVDILLDDKALKLTTVGYGVSQSLPVLVEILARKKKTWFAIQQPEVHLHPRAQAALGDMIFEMSVRDRKCFLIETHSDFMIDRFRINLRKGLGSRLDSQVLFFERRNHCNVVTPISIGENGELSAKQPASYREFFIREQMNLLEI